jgi:phosphatidate cytidylyltransferase
MSAAHQATRLGGRTASQPASKKQPASRRTTNELLLRVLIGVLLAAIAIGATFVGGYLFAGFVAVAAVAAAREWHRMVGTDRFGREWIATSLSVTAAIVAVVMSQSISWPAGILIAGALLAAALGATRGVALSWSALGPLYIGVPACALVALREHAAHGDWIVLGVFLVIWSADTGALAAGRMFGGPKLIPSLSPSKTWSGLIGGLALPAIFAAGFVSAFGGSPLRGFALGLLLAAVGHSGDLFESWVKRRVGRKDSGKSLPGHGGVLDRLDSTLFVAPLAALLVFVFGVAQLFGVHA